MALQVKANDAQRVFVIPAGNGYSCFGYDNCFRDSKALVERMHLDNVVMPKESEVGTVKQYAQYTGLVKLARDKDLLKDTWFTPGTPEAVQEILELYRKSKKLGRLRLFFGDKKTGRDWLSEHDVIGTIGRSTGVMKVPLMIPTARSTGGMAILDDCIVRIISVDLKTELYRHPDYHRALLTIAENEHPEYLATVLANGEVHARFKSVDQARRWIGFMSGSRMSK